MQTRKIIKTLEDLFKLAIDKKLLSTPAEKSSIQGEDFIEMEGADDRGKETKIMAQHFKKILKELGLNHKIELIWNDKETACDIRIKGNFDVLERELSKKKDCFFDYQKAADKALEDAAAPAPLPSQAGMFGQWLGGLTVESFAELARRYDARRASGEEKKDRENTDSGCRLM